MRWPDRPPRPDRSRWATLRAWTRSHPRAAEAMVVAAVLLALELLVFRGYFTGSAIPKYDFAGGYNLEAYAWWHDGSFFDPPQWMRYMYGGYPAVANVQNSSYYLPVGLTSGLTDFTLHASAVLSALHVAFGAVGVHVFLRRWGVTIWSALVGMMAWFFAPGFFAHATHLDIMRAYAWLPWVLLITSVKWPWQRALWSLPLATLLLWQALLASYPGTLVALAYTLPLWVAANVWMARPKLREYLLPLAVAGTCAVLMTALRFLPVMLTRGTYPQPEIADTSYFGPAMVGTVLFPEVNVQLGWFSEMSSNFVPASVVALVAFAPLRNRLVRVILAIGAVSLICGLPMWPWHDLFSKVLPGMNLSRFRMADFRLVAVFSVVVVAILALDGLLHPAENERSIRAGWRRAPVVVLSAFAVVFAVVGIRYRFAAAPSITQWVLFAVSSVVLVGFATGRLRLPRGLLLAAIGLVVVISGAVQAAATSHLWTNDRVQVERESYGSSVDELLAQRSDGPLVQRPSRLPAPPDYTGTDAVSLQYGAVFYTGGSSVIGYVNLRGTETFQVVRQQLETPEPLGAETRAFWEAAGMVIEGLPESLPNTTATSLCATTGECGEHLTALPVEYGSDGHFVYDIEAAAAVPVMLNEASYRGWHAELCALPESSECHEVATVRGAAGQVTLQVPQGEWRLRLDYRLPGQNFAWLLFVVGFFGASSAGGALALLARRARGRDIVALVDRGLRDVLPLDAAAGSALQLELMANTRSRPPQDVAEFTEVMGRADRSWFSQNGEDGILLFLLALMGDPTRRSIEIGAGDGIENNTTNLIVHHGYDGLLVDPSVSIEHVGREFFRRVDTTRERPPRILNRFVNVRTVQSVVSAAGFDGEVDVLSIDVDGNDFWLARALTRVDPKILVLELNLQVGPDACVTIGYSPKFSYWDGPRTGYLGASVRAYDMLARARGLVFAGCDRTRTNGFWVRRGLIPALGDGVPLDVVWNTERGPDDIAHMESLLASWPWVEISESMVGRG